jgi:hypothetical protein
MIKPGCRYVRFLHAYKEYKKHEAYHVPIEYADRLLLAGLCVSVSITEESSESKSELEIPPVSTTTIIKRKQS